MPLSINDFFTGRNIVTALGERAYEHESELINIVRASSRNFYQPIYVVDFYRRNLLYVSGNIQFLCGISPEQMERDSANLYLDYVPEEEGAMLLEVIDKAFELYYTFPVEDRYDWTLSYYFHLRSGNTKRLIHHKITPLKLTPEGRIWLAMCTFSLSSRKDAGHPNMRHFRHPDYYHYSLDKHLWYYKEGVVLTDMEKDILILSSQGYIMKEMSQVLGKSEDAIKFYKRQLFAKIGVKNITEAVFAAINDNLL